MKRQRENNTEDNDDNQIQKFQVTASKMNCPLITQLEDLSNEIFYEIFEYLDFSYIYQAFINLNERFENLINDPILPINADFSLISRTNIITPNLHRMKSLRLPTLLSTNDDFLSFNNIFEMTRLETLILDNISNSYPSDLRYLHALPRLTSLVLIDNHYLYDQDVIYCQIFSLFTLRYCKISLGLKSRPTSNSLLNTNAIFSSIEHLVIDNIIHIDLLYAILSYLPHLRRLSIGTLFGSDERRDTSLNMLSYLSIRSCFLSFSNFALLARNVLRHLRMLCISTQNNLTYLDADQWQDLIVSTMSNLKIFDLQSVYHAGSICESMIDHFTSSFWTERQWFFASQCAREQEQKSGFFYSTKPYRRQTFTLYGEMNETNPFNSVRHLHIKNIQAMINCPNYFSKVTQLFLSDYSDAIYGSVASPLMRSIPLQQLTTLSIDYTSFPFIQLIDFLRFAVNIQTLKLSLISLDVADCRQIEQNEDFQLISRTNKVRQILLTTERPFQSIELLIRLCPRLDDLKIWERPPSYQPMTELLLLTLY